MKGVVGGGPTGEARRGGASFSTLALVSLLSLSACGSDDFVSSDASSPDASPDSPIDAPAGCELAKDPKDSPACIADSVGIFVDATSGLDSNDGSKAKPVKTIGAGLSKVGNKPRIYICEGTYSENVKLATATSLYGGFTCGTWAADGKVVAIDATGIVVAVTTTTALRIVDLTLKAHAAAAAGSSAVGALCASGSNVTFSRVKVVADAGKDGVAGAEDATVPAQATKGTNASGNSGGVNGTCSCPDGVTTGGPGGNGPSQGGGPGEPPDGGAGQAGAGGTVNCVDNGAAGFGKTGASAAAGNAGPGATKFGSLSDPGWTPTPGTDGTAGLRAQGGGGGGARTGGGGGAGGCGGCGGKLGGGGGGGGASLGVVSFNATVALVSCEVTTGGAGNGGVGGKGQVGQTGGNPGGDPNFVGCSGGQGGNGGPGGSGGGGAGGLSVGILWKGSAAPTIDASTTAKITVAAKGGTKGTGGTPGTNDGIDGVAQAVLEVK